MLSSQAVAEQIIENGSDQGDRQCIASFVAEVDHKLAGFAELLTLSNSFEAAELSIFVSKSYQARGVGSALMKLLLKYADNIGLKKIALKVDSSNFTAYRFFVKFGFQTIGATGSRSGIRGEEITMSTPVRRQISMAASN